MIHAIYEWTVIWILWRKARSLRRRYQKQGDKSAFNRQSKVCARLVQQKRRSYYSSLFIQLNNTNQKELFKTFNKLFDQNKNNLSLPSHDNPSSLADAFNNYFLNKVSNIRSTLPSSTNLSTTTPVPPFSSSTTYQLSSFDLTSIEELRHLIKTHGIKTMTHGVKTLQMILSLLSSSKKILNYFSLISAPLSTSHSLLAILMDSKKPMLFPF